MKIAEFVDAYRAKNFMNTPQGAQERSEWICKELQVKKYISFRDKRKIAEMIVEKNIDLIDGIKKYNSIDAYIGLVVSSIMSHTVLEFSQDPVADYDLLAESGLLPLIISEFQESHSEIDTLLKMVLAEELEDNNTNVLIGHFLDNILKKVEMFSGAFDGFDAKEIFSNENVAKIVGLLNK